MENLVSWTVYAPLVGVAGLIVAALVYTQMKQQNPGNEKMVELGEAIHEGAMVFLKSEYKLLAIFIAVVFLLSWHIMPDPDAVPRVRRQVAEQIVALGRELGPR